MELSSITLPLRVDSSVSPVEGAEQLIENGDFTEGHLADWTAFTTLSGTLGFPPDPKARLFDVSGSEVEHAAEFQVGQAGDVGTEEGGGLMQTIHTKAGVLAFSAAFAKHVNLEGGTFSVLLDGVTEDTVSFGIMPKGTIDRGTLSFDVPVTAGSHVVEILITRDFTNGSKRGDTPFQYVTDISATQPGVGDASATTPAAPAHRFVAAMAGMGSSAGGAIHTAQAMAEQPHMVSKPHAMIA
jgi:hypothetical protein